MEAVKCVTLIPNTINLRSSDCIKLYDNVSLLYCEFFEIYTFAYFLNNFYHFAFFSSMMFLHCFLYIKLFSLEG